MSDSDASNKSEKPRSRKGQRRISKKQRQFEEEHARELGREKQMGTQLSSDEKPEKNDDDNKKSEDAKEKEVVKSSKTETTKEKSDDEPKQDDKDKDAEAAKATDEAVGTDKPNDSDGSSDDSDDDNDGKMKLAAKRDREVNFNHLLKEINKIDFGFIRINQESLSNILGKFIAIGSIIHKLTPDDLTIVANAKGKYPGKETKNVQKNEKGDIPNTLLGLMANGTKFFDAVIYLSMEKSRRPKPVYSQLKPDDEGNIRLPTYDDLNKLTTNLFILFFYLLIRAHPPSTHGENASQNMPKFITTVMGVTDSLAAIAGYVASFDLVKINPSWVKSIPTRNMSQEALNRLGLGVAGYRLTSIFNIIEPDLYSEKSKVENEFKQKKKPAYLDIAVTIAKSFKSAGYCWDFHPVTRSPDIIRKYGNINKNMTNLILESYMTTTIERLVKLKKLAVMPTFDEAHTDYRAWELTMVYQAKHRIFPLEEDVVTSKMVTEDEETEDEDDDKKEGNKETGKEKKETKSKNDKDGKDKKEEKEEEEENEKEIKEKKKERKSTKQKSHKSDSEGESEEEESTSKKSNTKKTK